MIVWRGATDENALVLGDHSDKVRGVIELERYTLMSAADDTIKIWDITPDHVFYYDELIKNRPNSERGSLSAMVEDMIDLIKSYL